MSDTTPTPDSDPIPEKAPVASSPEMFGLEYVQQLRSEAAKYRTEKKDAVDAAVTATNQQWEEKASAERARIAELQGRYDAKELELAKLKVAIGLEVPAEKLLGFVDLVKGSTEDEIKASAQSVLDLIGGFNKRNPATDPTQGKGGGPLALNGDPLLAALKQAVGVR